jgi:hypothetical protein
MGCAAARGHVHIAASVGVAKRIGRRGSRIARYVLAAITKGRSWVIANIRRSEIVRAEDNVSAYSGA